MSQEPSRHWWDLVIGLLALMAAGQAIHWFITPASVAASYGRWWAVVAQAVLGIGIAIWFFLRARQARRES